MTEENHITESPAPKKRKGIATAIIALVALAVGVAGGLYLGGRGSKGAGLTDNAAAAHVEGEKYTCGMHPFIISDKPGNCPICGMALTKIQGSGGSAGAGSPAAKGPRKILFYRNPMNAVVTSPVPMKDEMGMDYVPVYEDEAKGGGGQAAGALPEGYGTLASGPDTLKLAGVRTAPAVRERIARSVRTAGIVVPDESRIRRVQSKIDGYVEKLFVSATGQVVRKGQPLLSLYSPELLASQQEYVKARETSKKFSNSTSDEVRALGEELRNASRRRLELFDVPASAIASLERTGTPTRTVTLVAPVSGYVTGKEVFEGTKVGPGMELLTVTDLSRVWIEADLYETEAGSARVGMSATLSLSADPGVRLKGRVAFVYPVLTPDSRTLKVRFEFPNPGLKLKPQMYADVSIDLAAATGVTIDDSAIIDTGVRRIVFVETGEGSFTPREVTVGVRGDGKAQILSGVKEGERVAIGANFLLDSESRMRAALTKMTGGSPTAPAAPPKSPSGHEGHGGAR
ncbi:MAG TPA: efflux RND transporter periplasmic adaptor subunit [Candidatus Deferrimicrobiaceae bacterium]